MLGLEGPLVDTLRDNAPRVVGGLRLLSILMASAAHPLLGLHGLFVLGSEAVLLLFGNRENVEQYKTDEGDEDSLGPIGKAARPHKYPLESSAALDVIGEIPHLILGAGTVFGWDVSFMGWFLGEESGASINCPEGQEPIAHGDHFHCFDPNALPTEPDPWELDYDEKYNQWQKDYAEALKNSDTSTPQHMHLTGGAMMVHGALGILGHLPLWLFGPEKSGHGHSEHLDLSGDDVDPEHIQEELEFAESKSRMVGAQGSGVWQWLQEHQIGVSSTLQVAIGITMIIATGMPNIYQYAGIPLIAAGTLQALLVNKRDFSAEAKKEDAVEKHVHHSTYDGTVITNGKDINSTGERSYV